MKSTFSWLCAIACTATCCAVGQATTLAPGQTLQVTQLATDAPADQYVRVASDNLVWTPSSSGDAPPAPVCFGNFLSRAGVTDQGLGVLTYRIDAVTRLTSPGFDVYPLQIDSLLSIDGFRGVALDVFLVPSATATLQIGTVSRSPDGDVITLSGFMPLTSLNDSGQTDALSFVMNRSEFVDGAGTVQLHAAINDQTRIQFQSLAPAPVPEVSSAALLAMGVGGLAWRFRRVK